MDIDLSQHTVLVVDDEIPYRMFVKVLLQKKFKMNVIDVENPIKAFEVLKLEPVSLIILDMEMPGMDGFTALKQIRQMPNLENTPVIICSALRSAELVLMLGRLKISDYIAKPASAETILTKVLKVFSPKSE